MGLIRKVKQMNDNDNEFKDQFWKFWTNRIRKKYKINATAAFLRFASAILDPKVEKVLVEILDKNENEIGKEMKQYEVENRGIVKKDKTKGETK